MLTRISDFVSFFPKVHSSLLFWSDETGFYDAEKDRFKWIKEQLTGIGVSKVYLDDIPIVRDSNGGISYIPDFSAHVDTNDIGFRPAAIHAENTVRPYEIHKGFPVAGSNMLYEPR